jgi:serine/threonine protein kinase HipA of HipAB toxin-antitoxin module
MVDHLRSGLHIELGDVAQRISDATDGYERQAHPEWFARPFSRLDAIRALLGVAGWSSSTPDVEVEVDLDTHGEELLAALTSQLGVEQNIKRELDREHAEKTARREATRLVLELSRFVAVAKEKLAVVGMGGGLH